MRNHSLLSFGCRAHARARACVCDAALRCPRRVAGPGWTSFEQPQQQQQPPPPPQAQYTSCQCCGQAGHGALACPNFLSMLGFQQQQQQAQAQAQCQAQAGARARAWSQVPSGSFF